MVSNSTKGGGQPGIVPTLRPSPRYNVASVAAPFVGVVAVLVFLGIVGTEGHWYWTWRGPAAVSILAAFCVAGMVSAFVALARSERVPALTVFGLILNAPVPLVLLWSGLSFLETWLRYG